ncbi:hypothetical protein [Oceanobacillus timonensis]|uniref:hypothetical protein n=1 Tax=Oceanobacillus timonensis TaxID=1926285 RepID=UPI0009BBBA58|nr:hypothetical protein [Oceanobacillus timonensis]
MNTKNITEQSKIRAEKIAKENGGFLVPVYSVIKTDDKGRAMNITHDHLNDVKYIDKGGV